MEPSFQVFPADCPYLTDCHVLFLSTLTGVLLAYQDFPAYSQILQLLWSKQ